MIPGITFQLLNSATFQHIRFDFHQTIPHIYRPLGTRLSRAAFTLLIAYNPTLTVPLPPVVRSSMDNHDLSRNPVFADVLKGSFVLALFSAVQVERNSCRSVQQSDRIGNLLNSTFRGIV